jgi:hypothetical protein
MFLWQKAGSIVLVQGVHGQGLRFQFSKTGRRERLAGVQGWQGVSLRGGWIHRNSCMDTKFSSFSWHIIGEVLALHRPVLIAEMPSPAALPTRNSSSPMRAFRVDAVAVC